MPIKLHELQQRTAVVQMDYLENTVTLEYKPGAFTPIMESALHDADAQLRPANGLAHLLAQLLASWDVVDDENNVMPVNEELLRQCPADFLRAIIEAIIGHMNPNAQSAVS